MATTAAQTKKEQEAAAAAKDVPATRSRFPSALARWERDLEGLFEDLFEDFGRARPWSRLLEPRRLRALGRPIPSMDVLEKGDEVIVRAELPGMTKEDIEVNLTDSTLTVKGEKNREEEVKEEDYHRCERSFGSILRTVDLPAEVKSDAAKASFRDGVLEVRLPKTEEAKHKSVKVQVQ
jgi:HSP20 family protein